MANVIIFFFWSAAQHNMYMGLLRKTYVECNDQLERYVHDLAQECDLPFTLNSR